MTNNYIEKKPSCRRINGMFIPQLFQVDLDSLPISDLRSPRSAKNMTRSNSTPNYLNRTNSTFDPLRKSCFSQNFFNLKETKPAPLSDMNQSVRSLSDDFKEFQPNELKGDGLRGSQSNTKL